MKMKKRQRSCERTMTLDKNTKQKIKSALQKFYEEEPSLINFGLREECMCFRIAYYLQQLFYGEYFVDCEYNRQYDTSGHSAKKTSDGKEFIADIIVHKRNCNETIKDDYLCFEIKHWKEKNKKRHQKDVMVLKELTGSRGRFSYHHGFHIILGEELNDTKIMMFEHGRNTTEDYALFADFFKDEEQ
ncbi:MAG: hypothetical protein Q8O89_01555 [Nanoarchaeota archaeon]|nr:hypothetical protein [Nanoarchaeota archaeon]